MFSGFIIGIMAGLFVGNYGWELWGKLRAINSPVLLPSKYAVNYTPKKPVK